MQEKGKVMTDFCQFTKRNGAAIGAVIVLDIWVGAGSGREAMEQAQSACDQMDKLWQAYGISKEIGSSREPGGSIHGDQTAQSWTLGRLNGHWLDQY